MLIYSHVLLLSGLETLSDFIRRIGLHFCGEGFLEQVFGRLLAFYLPYWRSLFRHLTSLWVDWIGHLVLERGVHCAAGRSLLFSHEVISHKTF